MLFTLLFYISDDVPSEPLNVAAIPLSPKSIQLSWEPPAQIKGRLMSYDIFYFIEGTDTKEENVSLVWIVVDYFSVCVIS